MEQPKGERIERASMKSGHGKPVGRTIFSPKCGRTGLADASYSAKAGGTTSPKVSMHVMVQRKEDSGHQALVLQAGRYELAWKRRP